ncbi:hypothetical protein EPUS_03444 [Endocarpon pusillum Z07020]|uniref:Uncharacterized protein n=1 Tax=Endocarpon pusillum (strain Z07020 / HMAS-L-300199) TaxID=1263415 RepID=U1HLY1_ENDPU|nr:uncharacterized protein EPUS_03444 [Endocarpon pusillum Z07020]ERF71290.1 hypothetical protein EPUS_03444 [Endocarpon pusillum Z07020]
MSSTPTAGPSRSAKPNSAASKAPRASEWTEARSSESSGDDDQQAARTRLPLSTSPLADTGSGSGVAGARPNADALSYALATLSMDLPLIPMEQLPTWARRMPRKDPMTSRHIPALLQHRIPAHVNPTLTGAAAASQPSHQLPPPRQDDAIIWFMAPSPPSGPGHHLPTLCRLEIPQDDRTTEQEWKLRCREVSHMVRRVMKIRARGGPPRPAMRTNDPTDRKLMEWILAADRLHKVMPDPMADTVWVSPVLLVRDTLYRAWVRLFMEIFVLSPPTGSGL